MEHASPDLREDRDFMLDAVALNARALAHAGERLLADPTFITEAVRRNSWCLGYAPQGMHRDRHLVMDTWHDPPHPLTLCGLPPSELPGGHATELVKPEWQADKTLKR